MRCAATGASLPRLLLNITWTSLRRAGQLAARAPISSSSASGVAVGEALGDAAAAHVALGVASVRADVREPRVGHGVDRRHDRDRLAVRRVDPDPGRAVLLQPGQRAGSRSRFAHDRWRSSIASGCGASRSASGASSSSACSCGPKAGESWSRKAPSLPASASGAVAASIASASVGLEPRVEPHAAARAGRRALAQGRRERVERRRVARQQPVQLDVEDEAGRRLLGPARDLPLARHGVERRVDLDRVEALRVPGEAVARRQAGRIPLRDEAGVGPARGPDADCCHGPSVPG